MNLKLSNNAVGRLASPISANQTSFSLQAGQGAKFPVLGENDYFTLTSVRPDTSMEIMYVTARSFDVLTVLRGQEDTLALDFDALTIVENRITAKSIMGEIGLARSIVNAALQVFQPSVPVGIDQLRLLLLGAIGPDQLMGELNSRIALIDGSSAVGGSVNQRVKNATDAFIAALTQESADRTTYVQQYAYSKQGTNAAISAQASITQAAYTAYADAARQSAIQTSTAFAQSYTYSAADIRNAITASEQTLRAEFSGGTGGGPSYATQAYVQNYAYSIAQADGAIAAQTRDLRTTVGNNTAAINQSAMTLNGLSAQVFTKIDVNGYITGYGLASTGATSEFIVRAERFKFVGPDNNPQALFSITNLNGVATANLRGSLTVGSAPDNVLPDPNMLDAKFWGLTDDVFIAYPLSVWRSTRVISLGPQHGYLDRSTPFFPLERGGVYKFEFQVFCSPDYQGQLTVVAHLPNQEWLYMGAPQQGYLNGSSGLPTSFDGSNPGGVFTFTGTRTINSNDFAGRCQMRIIANAVVGYVQIGGIRITRVMDSTLITEKGVKAYHIEVDSLQAISTVVIARSGGVGAGVDLDKNGGRTYDGSSIRRFQFGNLDV